MDFEFRIVHLHKRFPLAISRGVITGSDNLFVSVTENGVTGWGEMAPGESEGADSAEVGERMLRAFTLHGVDPQSIHRTYANAVAADVAPCAIAALDMALWDLRAKQAGIPLYSLLGLGRRAVPTSVTIGINPPEVVRERVPLLLDGTGVKALKIKLGSPEGVEADKAMFAAVSESTAGQDVVLRVDANGGWSLDEARQMMAWLAERGVEYVEQPLVKGTEDQLADLFKDRALPIFVDESCRMSSDIPGFADRVDGVNLKLMKCGGITEALRIVATARAFGLKTMIGCMGESSVSIAAGASLGELFDYIDLDSHLNLDPDPATGAPMADGIVLPDPVPGHGGCLTDA
ncbi:Muconate cycloisomerase [Rhodovulum sp. P5]|uniref:dipeptide epimerase n=1 Tax=Rhodovulum sp. P5 TaxID=1564506 RepID=UPI0009C2B137|nr:dipeptide epimerase [Rhodovulum sp. P5]ARE41162.1 Muconate cycloisomerase [Rhodovulum sp. P5]